jgi:sporulation protein YqfC
MSWNDRKKRFQQKVANILDIPRDLMMDLPKITIVGDIQLLIENHRGIIEYSSEFVKIATTIGEMEVSGMDMVLRNILPDELVVEGKIRSLIFNSQV